MLYEKFHFRTKAVALRASGRWGEGKSSGYHLYRAPNTCRKIITSDGSGEDGDRMTKKNTPLKRLMAILPAKMSLNLQYKWKMGVWPDLNNPKNFNEKVQSRKIHDNNDLFAIISEERSVGKECVSTFKSRW